jgi:ABC-type branched-subunit amino acid transport system substrate-binding protein
VVVAGAAVALLTAACGGDGSSSSGGQAEGVTDDEIVIGTTTALTGVVAANCKPVDDGAKAWFAKVNKDGGIDGRTINNIVLDDGYDAAKALSNARELAAEPVLAYFGGCGSLQPPAVLTVADKEDIPYLFPSAGLPDVITNPHLRSLYPLFSDQFEGIMEYAVNDKGPGKAFLINARLPGYEVTRDAMKKGVEAAGGTVVGDTTITAGEPDMAPLALQVKASGADYIAAATNSADGSRIFKALEAADALPSKYYVGNSVYLGAAFLGPVGTAADGVVLTPANVTAPSSDKSASCRDVLEAAGVDVDISSLSGCAFAQVLTAALDETEDLNRDNLMKTLDGWKDKVVTDLLPPLTFSEDQHVGLSSMGMFKVENGEPVDVGETFELNIR